jgi:hypothetical protein
MATNFTMSKGDTVVFPGTVVDDNGVVDISSAAFRFTAKREYTDTDAHAVISLTSPGGIQILDGPNGKFQVLIQPSDTASLPEVVARLFYDVQITDGPNVYTVVKGILTIEPDVSQTTP